MPQPAKPAGRNTTPPEPAGSRIPWLPLLAIAVGFGIAIWWWRASLVTTAPDAEPLPEPSTLSVEAPSAPAAKPATSVAAAEPLSEADAKFLEMVQQTELTSAPFGFEADPAAVAEIAAGRVTETVIALETRAAAGDAGANVVLAQLQDCKRLESAVESVAAAADLVRGHPAAVATVPEERRGRLRLVADARNHHFDAGLESCRRAKFNTAAIAERLRSASEAGHEGSLWELGRQSMIQERRKAWAAAAMLGHVRAQYEMGLAYRGGYAGGKRYGEKEKIWLELASETFPRARERLAECYFAGCEGQPPDSEKGLRLLQQAALLGHDMRVEQMRPLGAGEGLPAEDRFALADFRSRLNELGCFGVFGYVRIGLDSWETELLMESSLSKFMQEQSRKLAQEYWYARGSNARSVLGCN